MPLWLRYSSTEWQAKKLDQRHEGIRSHRGQGNRKVGPTDIQRRSRKMAQRFFRSLPLSLSVSEIINEKRKSSDVSFREWGEESRTTEGQREDRAAAAVRIKVRVGWIPRKVAPNATWGPFKQTQGEGLGSCIKISAVADWSWLVLCRFAQMFIHALHQLVVDLWRNFTCC